MNWKIRSIAPICLFLVCSAPALAQESDGGGVHAAGSNILRFGDGATNVAAQDVGKRYFEEIANVRLFYQNLSIGLRYEMDDPSEVGRSYQDRNFRKRWIAYNKDGLDLQAGDVSALFGRGVAFNIFEARTLNYDSWLDGASAKTEFKIPKEFLNLGASVRVQAIEGIEDFYPIDTTLPMMHISARAANAEFGFFKKKLLLGASFVQAFTSTNEVFGRFTTTTNREINQPDFYVDLNAGEVEAFVEWTEDRTHASILNPLNPIPDTSNTGHALYGSLSYSNAVFGATLEYKDYAYHPHSYGDPLTNAFAKMPISNPPEVYKDFTYTSITRTMHAVNYDDELGAQFDASITAIPHITINLNAAGSSTHNKYDAADTPKVLQSVGFLPNLSDLGFYPFWEIFSEVEWEFDPANDLNYAKFAFHRRSDVILYRPDVPSESDYRSSTTLAAKVQYETTPTQSLLAVFEHQWSYDVAVQPDHNRLNELLMLQYTLNSTFTFGFSFDHSTGADPGATLNSDLGFFDAWTHQDDAWKNQAFLSLRIGTAHTLLASYGAERGGINCSGGICRTVPPFQGLRLTLTSQF